MNGIERQWEDIKGRYLRQIEQELATVRGPGKRQVLEDVEEHLDRRFFELDLSERDPASMEKIVRDMGPPEEYAELMEQCESETQVPDRALSGKTVAIDRCLTVLFFLALFFICIYLLAS